MTEGIHGISVSCPNSMIIVLSFQRQSSDDLPQVLSVDSSRAVVASHVDVRPVGHRVFLLISDHCSGPRMAWFICSFSLLTSRVTWSKLGLRAHSQINACGETVPMSERKPSRWSPWSTGRKTLRSSGLSRTTCSGQRKTHSPHPHTCLHSSQATIATNPRVEALLEPAVRHAPNRGSYQTLRTNAY
jgi:hypothetical protein